MATKKKAVKKRVVRKTPVKGKGEAPRDYDKAWLAPVKRDVFVAAFVRTGNATASAREAGYTGRSPGAAGYELLRIPDIARAVDEMRAAVRARCVYDLEKVHDELCRIAFSDMHDFATWDGETVELRNSKSLSPDLTRVVLEVKSETKLSEGVEEKKTVRIKLHDKQAAIDKLCRLQGWYAAKKRDVTVTPNDGGQVFRFVLGEDAAPAEDDGD